MAARTNTGKKRRIPHQHGKPRQAAYQLVNLWFVVGDAHHVPGLLGRRYRTVHVAPLRRYVLIKAFGILTA